MKSIVSALSAIGVALLLTACAGSAPQGKPLVISAEVDDHLRGYMREIDRGRAGAFAVSEDGTAASYHYCEHGGCHGQFSFSTLAIKDCEKFGRGRCVVLASNGVIKRPYTVAKSDAALAAQLAALLEQQPKSPIENPVFVSGARIRQELIGNSIVMKNDSGQTWAEYYDPSGGVRGHNWRGKRFVGTWNIDGDQICVDYTSIGSDWCGQFAEDEDGAIHSFRNGRFQKTYPRSVLQPGNPEGL